MSTAIDCRTSEVPKLPAVMPSHLLRLLDNGEITLRQYGWISLHANSRGRKYALEVIIYANKLYDFVKGIDDPSTLDTILTDAIELSNQKFAYDASNKQFLNEYHPISRRIIDEIDRVNDSPYGLSTAFQLFVHTVYDRKHLKYTKKPDFRRWLGIIF